MFFTLKEKNFKAKNMGQIINPENTTYLTKTKNRAQIINPENTTYLTKNYSLIPLNLFQTWHTLELPTKMKANVDLLKSTNPEFNHYLYDDNMCRDFIKQHFNTATLWAFDKLKPGAYKADLWRYCVLYIHGGIYLDIKFKCINGFKLIELTDKEYWVKDKKHHVNGIYQALMIAFPRNKILWSCIQDIIENCRTNKYRFDSLSVTGPSLIGNYFNEIDYVNMKLHNNGNTISNKKKHILSYYDIYRQEQKATQITKHYADMWYERDIYNYPILDPILDPDRLISSMSGNVFPNETDKYKLDSNITLPNFQDTKNRSFVEYNSELHVVCNWFPLQLGKINYDRTNLDEVEIKYNTSDALVDAIGGSHGYIFENEIWFILHKFQHFTTKNKHHFNYQHFFAVFDKNMNLKKYSELCKFGTHPIQHCTGLIVKDAEIILSYSLNNTKSIISVYDKKYIDNDIHWWYQNNIDHVETFA